MPHQYDGLTLKEFEKKNSQKLNQAKQLPCGASKEEMPKCYGQGCYHRDSCEAVKSIEELK